MGIVGVHPGSFRKSGKERTYGIRNLEECTDNGSCIVRSACNKAIGIGTRILRELEGPRGGGALVRRAQKNRANFDEGLIAYWYRMSMITYKWFRCRGITRCLFQLASWKERGQA
jgi:hypothetical protein